MAIGRLPLLDDSPSPRLTAGFFIWLQGSNTFGGLPLPHKTSRLEEIQITRRENMQPEVEIQKLSKRIIQLEGQVAFLYKHLGIEFVPEAAPNDDPRIVELLKKGNRLEAVKLYREIYSSGPQDAIAAVNEMQGRLGL